jgi:hypothetical protein
MEAWNLLATQRCPRKLSTNIEKTIMEQSLQGNHKYLAMKLSQRPTNGMLHKD